MKSDKRNTLKDSVVENIRLGNTVKTACAMVEITRKTFYEWLKSDKVFYQNTRKAKTDRCRVLESAMFKNALNGNATMQIFLSCNWMPDKYRNVNTIEHTAPGGVDIAGININLIHGKKTKG